MRTGEVVANISVLNEHFRLVEVDELVGRKRHGAEKMQLDGAEIALHDRQLNRLEATLEEAYSESRLPNESTTAQALDDFVVRLRLERHAGH